MQSFPCLLSSNLPVYFLLFQKTYPKSRLVIFAFISVLFIQMELLAPIFFDLFRFHFERHALKTERKIEFAKVNLPNTNFQ